MIQQNLLFFFFTRDSSLPYFCNGGLLFWRLLINERNLLQSKNDVDPIFLLPEENGKSRNITLVKKGLPSQTIEPVLFSFLRNPVIEEAYLNVVDSNGTEYQTCLMKGGESFGRSHMFVYLWQELVTSFYKESIKIGLSLTPFKFIGAFDEETRMNLFFIAPYDFDYKQNSVTLFNQKSYNYTHTILIAKFSKIV